MRRQGKIVQTLIAAAICALAGAPAARSQAQIQTPAQKPESAKPAAAKAAQASSETIKFVSALYASPMAAQNAPISKRLEKLRAAALANSKRLDAPVAGLDFAFELNAQDSEPGYQKTLRITQLRNDGKRARVRATFRNHRPVELWYELLRENGVWVIDDVQSRRDPRWSLSGLYAMGAKEK